MGTIDKLWVKLSCEKCDAEETSSALDGGSGWGGSYWGNFGPFTTFDVVTEGGERKVPKVVSATCRDCKAPASVETEYGYKRPEGF